MIDHLPTKIGLYLIANTINGKVWVGQAKGEDGIRKRCRGHISLFNRGKNSPHLQRAWDKYGSSAFSFKVLMTFESYEKETLDQWENFFIEKFKSYDEEFGYNINKKAYGPGKTSDETKAKLSKLHKGRKRSEETKRRISEATTGKRKKPYTRKPISEETRRKMSEAKKNMSQETRNKIALARTGSKASEETRQKMSLSHKKL